MNSGQIKEEAIKAIEPIKTTTVEDDDQRFEYINGYKVDTLTGEAELVVEEAFRIDSQEKADWVLKKYNDAEAEIAKLTSILKGVQDRLGRLINQEKAKLAGLDKRFKVELELFAAVETAKTGTRQYLSTWAELKFKHVPATVKIADVDAVRSLIVEEFDPAWVKEEKSYSFELPKDFYKEVVLKMEPEKAAAYGFEIKPAYDSFSIKTTGRAS